MAIDFNDPGQMTKNDQTIPINTPEKYAAGELVVRALYGMCGVPWTDASAARYEERVLDGQNIGEILKNTYDEYLTRSAD
jgi:hypothetical protein